MISRLIFCVFILILLFEQRADAQVCDDLLESACETSIHGDWVKILACGNGELSIQYCHPRFYIGSGHNLTVAGSTYGTIVFDELLDKTTLGSGLKVRKAIGKNQTSEVFTGIFTYDKDDHIENCYIKSGEDRSPEIIIPRQ